MLATLVWGLADRSGSPGQTGHRAMGSPATSSTPPARPPQAARTAARRFVLAFLAHEVGAGGAPAATRIRAGAVPALADTILDPRPARPVGESGGVRVTSLRVDRLPHRPDLVLVSGSARRASGPEPFAFLFVRRADRWLALAPAE
jgi:hypothetical protein